MCRLRLALQCTSSLTVAFFFNDTATTEIYTLSLHDALPISTETSREEVTQETEKPEELREDELRNKSQIKDNNSLRS